MTDILLLEGPDGFKYKGTQISEEMWNVESFLTWNKSEWWRKQCSHIHWHMTKKYTTSEMKETFSILAASETYIKPRSEVILHWD